MMTNAQITAAIFSLAFATVLLVLLRRDHLYIRQVAFWLAITLVVLAAGWVPGLVDRVGGFFGISYPPMFFALAAILVLLIKGLEADLTMTRMERQIRRLSQRLAMLDSTSVTNSNQRTYDPVSRSAPGHEK
jgi:hypothetical protein